MSRTRQGAYIYRRKGRRGWYAYLDRENRFISLGTDDENTASEKLSALLNGRRLRTSAPESLQVSEIFSQCLERAYTNHTRKTAYELGLDHKRVLTWLEVRGLKWSHQVDKTLIEDYKTSRHRFDKVSASRVNRELSNWKKAMKLAVELHTCSPDILNAFVKLREPRPIPNQRGLLKTDLEVFLEHEEHPGYWALFRTVLGSGIRDDEMRHLQLSDITFPWLTISPKAAGLCDCCPKGWTTKGYRYRMIPISKKTEKAAKEFVKHKPQLNLEPKSVWNRIRRACKAAKLQRFSMHDLRRAWASHMLHSGHKIQDISQWLGHADLITTMRYLRIVRTETPKAETLPF